MKYSSIIKALLVDRNVLYLTLFAALTNLFMYIAMREYEAVIFFLVIGLLTSYFSKNMIIILLSCMFATFAVVSLKIVGKVREGMTDKEKEEEGEDISEAERADMAVAERERKGEEVAEGMKAGGNEPVGAPSPSSVTPKVNTTATIESAYAALNNMLSSSEIKKMTQDSAKLAEQQKMLMSNIEKLEPMMNTAQKMMDSFNVSGIADQIVKIQNSLTGGSNTVNMKDKQRE